MAVFMITIFDAVQNILGSDSLFWFCALSGTGLFALQFVLVLFGGDLGDEGASEELSASHFKWLSKQALTSFLMMFGWTGLTCKKEWHFGATLTILTALAVGLFAVVVLGAVFKWAKRLRSPGAVFRIEDAIGKEATVYSRVPKTGVGKITLSLNHLTYEIDAVSHQGEELPSFIKVQIIGKLDDTTAIVVQR